MKWDSHVNSSEQGLTREVLENCHDHSHHCRHHHVHTQKSPTERSLANMVTCSLNSNPVM